MNKAEKLNAAQNYIDGINSLTIRFCPDGVDEKGKYIKKEGRYFTSEELKQIKLVHDAINNGMKTQINSEGQEYTDFDGAKKKNPIKTKAKEILSGLDDDIDDIIDLYFDSKNKDKVGDKAKKVK